MAVLLSQWSRVEFGVRVTFISTSSRSRGEPCVAMVAACQGCRELSLKVEEYSGLQRRGRDARFCGGRESTAWCSRQQMKRCAVHDTLKKPVCSLVAGEAMWGSKKYPEYPWELIDVSRLFDPEDFDASKLTVRFEDNANDIKANSIKDLLPRKYTLTHSDVTGELLLSIGPSFNERQLADWYTRLMRDEIVAEWRGSDRISLHVHCHVSGGHILLAPAALRNSIFEREMPLVLEAIRHGDKELLAEYAELNASTVWVHFHSSDPEYNRADCWGPLFYAVSPMRRVAGKSLPSCISVPFSPPTLVEAPQDSAELCSVMSP